MRIRSVVASVALAAVCCSSGGASPAPSSVLKTTTLAVARGEIAAFAQDGARLAWIRSDKPGQTRCGGRIVVFDLWSRQRIPLEQRKGPSCSYFGLKGAIAIGGNRAVWEALTVQGNEEFGARAVTAATNDRRNRDVGEIHTATDQADWPPALVAGDGSTLVFYSLCSDVDLCGTRRDVWSGVRKIVGGKAYRLFKVNLPLALAAAGNEVAALKDLYPSCCNYAPRWSPDGTRIAWSRQGAIYVMNADGTGRRRVAAPPGNAESPQWSPDGTELAYGYTDDRSDGPSEVHVVNADGSDDRRLATGSDPEWSPSGARLSFVRSADIWTINSDGSSAKRLTNDAQPNTSRAEWSPDGTRLASTRKTGLYVIRTDGTGQTRIAQVAYSSAPEWSPTGTQIAWTYAAPQGQRLAVVNADGSGRRDLADEGFDPAWSPDGTRLAFDGRDAAPEVSVIPSAGGAPKVISRSPNAGDPSWSPDGNAIVYGDGSQVYHDRHTAGIYRVAPDGSGLKKLFPADQTGVDVRDVRTGARTGSFIVAGDADAMAFSRSFVAVLVRTPLSAARMLQVYRPLTGALVSSVSVPSKTAPDIAATADGIVVFYVGREIRAFEVRTGAIRTISITRTSPIGLSIDGRRVAWAEVRGPRSVVKAVVLPAGSS